MTLEIPGFVTRGMSTLADPRDPSTIHYSTEAQLRDAMALHWWLHGWTVRTEVKVPDCGRVDVLAESGDALVVIELKKQIDTATEARLAYQQAHTYSAYLTAGRHWQVHTLVTAGSINIAALTSAERAFPAVWGADFFTVAGLAVSPEVYAEQHHALASTARARSQALLSLADLARGGAVRMTARSDVSDLRKVAS